MNSLAVLNDKPEGDMDVVTERDRQVVHAVLKAFEILDIVGREQQIGISELTRKSRLKKTTVARLVKTLELAGMVEQDRTNQRYSMSIKVFELGSRILDNLDIRRQIRPLVEDFVQNQQKSALLSILHHDEVIYIDKIEAQELFRIITPIGGRTPAHCGASGKAMLAYLAPESRRQLLGGKPLKAYTAKSITDLTALERDLATTRERGYALDFEERHLGLCSVAAPVFDRHGLVVAAISVPRMTTSINEAELAALGAEVSRLAKTASRRMGWMEE